MFVRLRLDRLLARLDLGGVARDHADDAPAERALDQMLADLPTACDVGSKKNSKGYKETWIGYKLHLDGVIMESSRKSTLSRIEELGVGVS